MTGVLTGAASTLDVYMCKCCSFLSVNRRVFFTRMSVLWWCM